MLTKIFYMLLFSLFITANIYASDGADKQEENKGYAMEELIVTESKILQVQENVTQKIDVITQEEIDSTNYNNKNISEIFMYQPGTFVSVLSRNDANWGSYGGLGPKYNVYLLDGLPIDSFVDTMSLDPWILERAEVHRGPASVMYPNYLTMDFAGNETPLSGITNLILKDKIDIPQTRIQLGYGSWNTLNGKLYNQGSKGNFNYFIGANYEQSDYTNYGADNSWLNMIDNPEYKKTKLFLKTTYFIEPDKQSVSFFANHTQHTGDAGRPNRGYNHIYDTINAAYKNQINELILNGMKPDDAEKNAPILLEAQELLRKWEAGDPEVIALWKKMNEWVYEGFDETYQRLGVSFDKIYYESDTYLIGKKAVLEGLEKNIFYKHVLLDFITKCFVE